MHAAVAEQRAARGRAPGKTGASAGRSAARCDQVAQQRVALEERGGVHGQQPRQRLADSAGRALVVGVAVRPASASVHQVSSARSSSEDCSGGERRVEQAEHELGEQPEQLGAVRASARSSGQLRSRMVWKPVDEQVGVAEGVEVLAQGLGERGAHAVQALDRLHAAAGSGRG